MITITTCQTANTSDVTRLLASYLDRKLGVPVRCVDDIPWQERCRLIDAGEIDIGWICGLPYVNKVKRPDANIELLAAPVMAASRYEGLPRYYSDVVVRRDSAFHTFSDLRGVSWSYNEPGSQSGYGVTVYHLAKMGETGSFFGRVVGAGGHLASLKMILAGEIDASAIDSTVLEWQLARRPELAGQIRIIETLGPSPIPPLVIQRHLRPELTQAVAALLSHLEHEAEGRTILAAGGLSRFVRVNDSDYDPIREMAHVAEGVVL